MSDMSTAELRERLTRSLSAEELDALCYDHFRPVYEQFATGMSRVQKIQRLIEHCERRGQRGRLQALLQAPAPASATSSPQPHAPASAPASSLKTKLNNHIALVASLITIFVFVTGFVSLRAFFPDTAETFTFSVVVQDKTGEEMPHVRVAIDLPGAAPLTAVTSNSGVAVFDIPAEYRERRVVVRVSEDGYVPYAEPVVVHAQAASHVVLLEPE